MRFFLLFLPWLPSLCLGEGAWSCGQSFSPAPSRLIDGFYTGTLNLRCQLDTNGSMEQLAQSIRNMIRTGAELHRPPIRIRAEGLNGESFDLTHTVPEESLRLREEIHILHDKTRLLYRTRSREIFASGLASYLKQVSFSAEVRRQGDQSFQIDFSNSVGVKRPWFAIAPIFKSIADGISEDKLTVARDRLLPFIQAGLQPSE